ncbi:MAG: hypothetical protein IJN11_06300 [Oscillospiraceae bacterium]|nr:hypothetical protein [Oscillospiraceae bacterium]
MDWMKENGCMLLLAAIGVCLLVFYLLRKRRVRTFLLGGTTGLGSLILLHIYGGIIGFTPTLSVMNIAVSVFLGVPGVVLLYVMERIFQ